jgi:hypothetical protein
MKLQGGGNGFNTASNLMNTAGDIANMFPGVGTAIGAGLKGLSFVSDMFAKRQAVKDNQNLIAKNDRNIPIYQSNESVYPNPNQNMMQTGGVPTQGGVIQPVSSTGSVALGQTHDEGGIKYAPNIEVENKEGIHNVDDKTVVSSNVLKNPLTGKSFASEMVGLEKQKGDLEIDLKKELDKSKGKSTYTSIMLKKRIDELEVKIGELYEQQEALASKMGLRDEQGNPNQMSQQVVGNEEQIQNMQQQVMKQQTGGNIKRKSIDGKEEYFLNSKNQMVDKDGIIRGSYKKDTNIPGLEYGISNTYYKVGKDGNYINYISNNTKVDNSTSDTTLSNSVSDTYNDNNKSSNSNDLRIELKPNSDLYNMKPKSSAISKKILEQETEESPLYAQTLNSDSIKKIPLIATKLDSRFFNPSQPLFPYRMTTTPRLFNEYLNVNFKEDSNQISDKDWRKEIKEDNKDNRKINRIIKKMQKYGYKYKEHEYRQTGGQIQDNNGYLNSNLQNYTPVKLINSNHITTKNMAFPIEANGKVLYPNTGDYYFKKKPVVEKPLNFKSGGTTKIGTDFNDIDALNSEFHKYNIPLKIENKNTIYVNNERKYFPNGIDDNIIKELLTPFNSTNLIEDYQSGGNLSYPEAIADSKYLKNRTSKYDLGKTEFKEDKANNKTEFKKVSNKPPFRGEELFSYGTQIAGSLLPMVMPLKKTELNYYDEGKGYGYLNNAYRSALLYPKKMEELSNYNLNRDLAQYSQALTNNGSNMNRTPMLQNLYAEGRSKANDLIANSQANSLELQNVLAESIYNKDRSKYLTNQEINAQNDNFANNYLATKYINPLSKLSESTVQQLEAKRNYIEETTKNNKIAGYELVYNPETGRHEYIRINSNAKSLTNTPSSKLQSVPVPNLKLETPDYKLNK